MVILAAAAVLVMSACVAGALLVTPEPAAETGERVWMEFDLEPDDYELVCPLPDVVAMMEGGAPLSHLLHGMRHTFTVRN